MARMTAFIRESIINNAVKNKKFQEREQAIIAERAALAEEIRIKSLESIGLDDSGVTKLLKQLHKLRKEYEKLTTLHLGFSTGTSVLRANVAGQTRFFYFNGTDKEINPLFGEPNSMCKHFGENTTVDRSYGEQLDEINSRHKKLIEEHQVLVSTLDATIRKFTTVAKLVDSWPEVKELLPATEIVKTGTDVSLSVETLNTICGLPS